MPKYIVRPGTYFDAGTEAEYVSPFGEALNDADLDRMGVQDDARRARFKIPMATFRGIKNGRPDEEPCYLSEFEVITSTI